MADYFDEEQIINLITEYQSGKKSVGNLIMLLLYPLAKGVCNKEKFHSESKEDSVQDCLMECFKKFDKFDLKANKKAFSYFTKVCQNTIRFKRMKKYNKENRDTYQVISLDKYVEDGNII